MATTTKKVSGANDFLGTGRRKTSVARVRIRPGSGTITVNQRPIEEFFPIEQHQKTIFAPLEATGHREEVDVVVRVHGGGIAGQAGATMMGIARALKIMDVENEPALREGHFLTRDGRMKERKKYGLHGARRGTQFSKR